MKLHKNTSGESLTETMFGAGLTSVVSLVIYSMLSVGMTLGAKNVAINTAHQQARTAMLHMLHDLHSAVSLPQLVDVSGNVISGAGPAAGISFQLWSIGPLRIATDSAVGQNVVNVAVPAGAQVPVVGQRLIVPTHQIEDDITAVSNPSGSTYALTLAHNLTTPISGTQSPTNYNIICFITDRCSYVINHQQLQWNGPATRKAFSVMGSDILSATPFGPRPFYFLSWTASGFWKANSFPTISASSRRKG